MVKKTKQKDSIADKVWLLEDFAKLAHAYYRNAKSSGISAFLNNQYSPIDRLLISYRKINHWYEQGLLDDNRKGNEWRKVTIIEFIWLNIIVELREWGLSIEMIKLIKQSLTKDSKAIGLKMPMLEYCAYLCTVQKTPITLIVFRDGSCVPISYHSYKYNLSVGMVNHLNININRIVQAIFPNSDLTAIYPNEIELTQEQNALLEFVNTGQMDSITVIYKNGKIDLIEEKQREETNKKIAEILKDRKYQQIEFNVNGGNVVFTTRKVKVSSSKV